MSAYTREVLALWIAAMSFMCIQADNTTINEAFLAEHNFFRHRHGCPPLELDAELCEDCAKHAQELSKKEYVQHEHNQTGFGENLCINRDDPLSCVSLWYFESVTFNYNESENEQETGHFTQMIWKSSKKLGVGVAKNPSGTSIVVARYEPAGNSHGQFRANVPRKPQSRSSKASLCHFKTSLIIVLILFQMPFLTI